VTARIAYHPFPWVLKHAAPHWISATPEVKELGEIAGDKRDDDRHHLDPNRHDVEGKGVQTWVEGFSLRNVPPRGRLTSEKESLFAILGRVLVIEE